MDFLLNYVIYLKGEFMRRLLDTRLKRQMCLVEELWDCQIFSMRRLSNNLNATEKTIRNDIEYINSYMKGISIMITSRIEVTLIKESWVSKSDLYAKILESSNQFKIMESLFFEEFKSFDELSSKNFVSTSHVKRLVNQINEVIQCYGALISPTFSIVGNQRSICQIMLNYMMERYGSVEVILGVEKSLLIEHVIEQFYSSNHQMKINQFSRHCLINKMKMHVYLMMERLKMGFKIYDFVPEYPYFHCQTIIDNFYQQFKTVFDIELTEFNISQLFYMCFLPYSKKFYLTIGMREEDFSSSRDIMAEISCFIESIEDKLMKICPLKERLVNDIYWSSIQTLGVNHILYFRDKEFYLSLKSRYPVISGYLKEKLTEIFSKFQNLKHEDIDEMVYHAIFMLVTYWDDLLENIEQESMTLNAALVMSTSFEHLSCLKDDIEYQFRSKYNIKIFNPNNLKKIAKFNNVACIITDGTIPELRSFSVPVICISDILDKDSSEKLINLYLNEVKRSSQCVNILA